MFLNSRLFAEILYRPSQSLLSGGDLRVQSQTHPTGQASSVSEQAKPLLWPRPFAGHTFFFLRFWMKSIRKLRPLSCPSSFVWRLTTLPCRYNYLEKKVSTMDVPPTAENQWQSYILYKNSLTVSNYSLNLFFILLLLFWLSTPVPCHSSPRTRLRWALFDTNMHRVNASHIIERVSIHCGGENQVILRGIHFGLLANPHFD